ncbi:hypothetical protein PR202_gb11840 [Eleusine coracana subsp. coracana]|uniref:Uncharacterized protein n=1 Tax=Eleusine coracana subsp. coracana TaxID=191504 RepID=A0AAV5EPC2_ELECO|nr:hypothetical protein PR202_gb11840 [Eleusine coracana subsp. coracana]
MHLTGTSGGLRQAPRSRAPRAAARATGAASGVGEARIASGVASGWGKLRAASGAGASHPAGPNLSPLQPGEP